MSLNNSGDILATGRQRNGTVYVDGTADQFSIVNSGSIDASTGAGSGVSVQVGSFDGDVQSGLIVNSGSIVGSGDLFEDAGIRLFANDLNTSFSGNIVNFEGGSVSTTGAAAAVLVEDGVSFDGDLINAGSIDGSIFLSDGDLILGETSELSLTISSLDEFDVIETTGSLVADGILDITFDGLLPSIGQQFDLLDFGIANGAFDFIQAGNIQLDTSDLLVGGSVTVTGVPEPGTFVILSLTGLAFVSRRRRTEK